MFDEGTFTTCLYVFVCIWRYSDDKNESYPVTPYHKYDFLPPNYYNWSFWVFEEQSLVIFFLNGVSF